MRRREGIDPVQLERNLQRIMSTYVCYERNEQGLQIALERVRTLNALAVAEVGARNALQKVKAHEALNMIEMAETIILAARERKESRMFLNHRRTDYTERNDDAWLKHLVVRKEHGKVEVSVRELS